MRKLIAQLYTRRRQINSVATILNNKNKNNRTARIAKALGISRAQANRVVHTFFERKWTLRAKYRKRFSR